ncbi:MAG: hypothetical protein GTN84_03505 [Hydrogenophaga sp.]|uniref:YciI family protein n=1 Tax=Hydrogenophaga sp. TaxID=1904254 RepID=UPI0016965A89|nr:hypothetical protein [Hydrogenophaga sp.]NIM40279.1 hypothetical protein [Hydrogenophaga sp.]NIN25510.1 hypothetical protein [Hydrogenophaga sp.]NIN30162.1 hypothetical protein [Hydrogenophaga sp.]NIN54463.1 hypothetical protein [Hydrogenophaga sp.]NIO50336.1 hypothetical protein [Hydrogenophaga sp.]
MHLVLLRFGPHRDRAAQHLAGHKAWLQRGFDDGVFVLAGSLGDAQGGAVLAHRESIGDLRERLAQDPFVAEAVVQAEIVAIEASRVDERLSFLQH